MLGAGRTDSGVHALGQVVAFDLDWGHGEEALRRAMNANLPPDLSVWEVGAAPQDFHPRFQAHSRRYRYAIYCSRVRQPLRDRVAWRVHQEFRIEPLEQATRTLIGRQDFAAFGSAPEPGGHTVRTVLRAGWRQTPAESSWGTTPPTGGWAFEIEADAFLHQMVRTVVGTLKQVAVGALSPEEFGSLMAARRRDAAGPPAPACGLCLMEVTY